MGSSLVNRTSGPHHPPTEAATKLDGTAKGGILVALADRFALPIHFIGVGESIGDLQVFDAPSFAKALTGA
jgi:fused signal recognition particle receptor